MTDEELANAPDSPEVRRVARMGMAVMTTYQDYLAARRVYRMAKLRHLRAKEQAEAAVEALASTPPGTSLQISEL